MLNKPPLALIVTHRIGGLEKDGSIDIAKINVTHRIGGLESIAVRTLII